jgi:Ubiquitin carboxyl-terminal hydrolase
MFYSTNAKILRSMFRPYFASSLYCSGGCQTKRLRQENSSGPILNEDGWIHIVNFQSPLIEHEGERSFEECFNASLKQQQECNCPRCGKSTARTVKDKFLQLPKIFLTQLNRSTNTQGKIQDHCEIPPELTVPIEDSVRSKYGDHKYRLAAVVAHSGDSSISGHYISYVRDPARTGGWIELDDKECRNIDFEEINHNKMPRNEGMLPFIMAWELIDVSEEKEAALSAREKDLYEKEAALQTREEKLTQNEKVIQRRHETLMERAGAFLKRKEVLEKALSKRERDLDQRERNVQVEKEVDDLFEDTEKGSGDQLAQEVDKGTDTATFCATFQNIENHDENARAIFKLRNFNPNAATKIESTVQLTDLEGNLRSIKKGTTVNDEFTINFNVKGSKKRKSGGDDEAGRPSPPSKKPKRSKKQAAKPRTSPSAEGKAGSSAKVTAASENLQEASSDKREQEPRSANKAQETVNAPPPPPRRSTRVNKGKNPRLLGS